MADRVIFTKEEAEKVVVAYSKARKGDAWLEKLARDIGKTKISISRFAAKHGLSDMKRIDNGNRALKKCALCSTLTTNVKYCSEECSNLGHSGAIKRKWAKNDSVYRTAESTNKRSNAQSKVMVERMHDNPSSIYSHTKKGWVDFKSGKRYFFRSGWEMRYAEHLDMLLAGKAIKDWTYEEDTFWFEKIKRGVRSYTPDFKIYYHDGSMEYHEVKGYMDAKSKTKLKRMAIYHPDVKVIVIGSQEMKVI
ncbi:endodeoxyribonuclease I [Caudoviricetes sp.]|nr:endodeoxyribonuclease I [Caudoviricetes sp.]